MVYPDWLDFEIFNEYKKMRKQIKKPLTKYAEKLAIGKLEKFRVSGQDIDEVLNQSILNCWQGLFEVKQDGNNRQFTSRPTQGSGVYESPSTQRAKAAFRSIGGGSKGDLAITPKHGTHIPQGRH